jgi:hypothetical protein
VTHTFQGGHGNLDAGADLGDDGEGQNGEEILVGVDGLVGELPAADDGQPRLTRVEHTIAETARADQLLEIRMIVGKPFQADRRVQQGDYAARGTDRFHSRTIQPPPRLVAQETGQHHRSYHKE